MWSAPSCERCVSVKRTASNTCGAADAADAAVSGLGAWGHLVTVAAGQTLPATGAYEFGNFRQGMLVSIPLHLDALPGNPRLADLERTLASRYRGAGCVSVVAQAGQRLGGRIDALALNGTDQLELCVFGSDELRQAVLVARLDNLGKGAAGAAVQNIALMLGLEL